MIVIGLTGSIGMGKTETARSLAAFDIPVFDSDAAVHDIYRCDTSVIASVGRLVPSAVEGQAINRTILSEVIAKTPGLLTDLERIVHPAVRRRRDTFLAGCRARGDKIAVLDIPLLFETGQDSQVDVKLVVSAPPDVQRRRVLARPGMTEEKLNLILAKQLPDAEKRKRADYVIDTSRSLEDARHQLQAILDDIRRKQSDRDA